MALKKDDAPNADKAKDAIEDVIDEGAGVPAAYEEAAEALPEKDEVQKEVKAAMLAETANEEAEHKANVVEASPNSSDTPSGYALQQVAGISDPVEQGVKYAQHKAAKRWGYVTPDLKDK